MTHIITYFLGVGAALGGICNSAPLNFGFIIRREPFNAGKATKLACQWCIIILLLFLNYVSLNAQELSSQAKVSLITVSPGKELYSKFGHSALWVSDPTQGIDKVYNYGTFDFRTEGFYLKFLRGTLPYQLSVSPMYYTMYGAQAENRKVIEQVLNLSPAQKQRLYNFLETNCLPENRQYAYRFFHDNCSTRLRDALLTATADSLQYSTAPIEGIKKGLSFRQWMNKYLAVNAWYRYGMNLAIGLPSDAVATPNQEMYLPNNLLEHIERAKINGKPLVAEQKLLLDAMPTSETTHLLSILFSPQSVFVLILLLTVLYTRYQKKNNLINFTFDKILFGILGLAGWILLLLWIATDHGVTAWNLNLLWAVPFHLPLILFLGKSQHIVWLKKYVDTCFWLAIIVIIVAVGGILFDRIELIPHQSLVLIIAVLVRLTYLRKTLA